VRTAGRRSASSDCLDDYCRKRTGASDATCSSISAAWTWWRIGIEGVVPERPVARLFIRACCCRSMSTATSPDRLDPGGCEREAQRQRRADSVTDPDGLAAPDFKTITPTSGGHGPASGPPGSQVHRSLPCPRLTCSATPWRRSIADIKFNVHSVNPRDTEHLTQDQAEELAMDHVESHSSALQWPLLDTAYSQEAKLAGSNSKSSPVLQSENSTPRFREQMAAFTNPLNRSYTPRRTNNRIYC